VSFLTNRLLSASYFNASLKYHALIISYFAHFHCYTVHDARVTQLLHQPLQIYIKFIKFTRLPFGAGIILLIVAHPVNKM